MNKQSVILAGIAASAFLGACSAPMRAPDAPMAVSVPTGNKLVMTSVGIGDLTYECRAKAGMTGAFEWAFVGPVATLYDSRKSAIGKYYGGPTWESNDGSKVTGRQLAVAPSPNSGAIPLQLVQANPATGSGAMTGITYIQRLNTVGGLPSNDACGNANIGARQTVKYQADYIFFRAS